MSPQGLTASTREIRSPGLVSVDGRTYPLRSALVRARAEGGLALTTLIQEFHNPHDEPLEVVYTMPLPAEGAVLGYTITMGARIIRGEIEVRERAEARYRDALYKGQTAGLLEQDRADTFQQRLGNVPAATDVRVEIDVLQPLHFLAATGEETPFWEYRFPTVVGVRYEGAPGRVSDAGRLDVDRDRDGDIPTRLGFCLMVADETASYGTITSPSHDIVTSQSPKGMDIGLGVDARLDRDLIVRWTATTPAVGVRMVEGRGVEGDGGRYALLTITPPASPSARHPRDLTVLIDSSGSMIGSPLDLAKRVVGGLLEGLEEGDRFEVLSFATSVQRLTRGMVSVTPRAIQQALRDVGCITAEGGTEMEGAMAQALCTLRPDSQRQVVLVTDGQIGFELEVIAKLRSLPAGVRVHAVGIGAAPNRSLTAFLARAGRGVELIANDETTAREAALRLRAATARPILTEIQVEGPAVLGVAPANPRDVLAGQPLVVAVELAPEGGRIDVSGSLASTRDLWRWGTSVPAAAEARETGGPPDVATTPLPVGALYGREAIADIEADAGSGERRMDEVDRRIEALGLRHQITSRRTSLVAILEEATTDPLAPRRRERLAVELPAGVSAEGVGLFGASSARIALPPGVGRIQPASTSSRFMFRIPFGSRDASMLPEATLDEALSPLAQTVELQGTVILRDDAEIVLEIEVPVDGFVLPAGMAEVRFRGRKVGEARVVPERSTSPGPHPGGLLVRLALRMEGGADWPETAEIVFNGKRSRPRRGSMPFQPVTIFVNLGDPSDMPQAEPPTA
jgi:Ca-activated chloride channel family protein